MARVLTKEQREAADFLARVYMTAAERKPAKTQTDTTKVDAKTKTVLAAQARKQARSVAESLPQWIDPDSGDANARATLASVLSDVVQTSGRTIYGLEGKLNYYRQQLRVLMPELEAAARDWTIKELNKQELKIGAVQLFVRNRLHDVHLTARAVRSIVTANDFVLPTTTPEQMREITGEKKGGDDTLARRLTRVQYMWAVRDGRTKSKQPRTDVSAAQATREAQAYDHLYYLMVHPRGVALVSALAASPGTGWVVADETFTESLAAIRTLRADVTSGDTLVWNFPPAVTGGVAEVGRGTDRALNRFALAWAQTRKSSLERALDIAGNAVLALGLIGGPVNVVAEVLDFVLSAIQTAVSFMRDVEQDQAATASAFAEESERLSKGPRRLGTVLQGAATIIQALALPATVSAITKTSKRAAQVAPPLPVRSTEKEAETLARGVNRDTTGAADKAIAQEARQLDAPATGKPAATQKELSAPKESKFTTSDPKKDFDTQRLASGKRQIRHPPQYRSKSRRVGNTVPELPILPLGLDRYTKKEKHAFFQANRSAYPPHIRRMIDDLPNPKQKMPEARFEEIDQAIRDAHTDTANRMAGGDAKPFIRSVRGAYNEGGKFASSVTDNKKMTLHGQIRGGGIAEFDSVRFEQAKIIEVKMNLDRLTDVDIRDQMMRQARFVEDWEKWSLVEWEIWDPDPRAAQVAEEIRITLPERLAERIKVVHMQ